MPVIKEKKKNADRRGFGISELASQYGVSPGFLLLEIKRQHLRGHGLGRR
jgi:hypothetical protein